MNKNSKAILLIIFSLIIIGFVVFIKINNINNQSKSQTNSFKKINNSTNVGVTKLDAKTGKLKYINNEPKFSLLLPNDFELDKTSLLNSIIFFNQKAINQNEGLDLTQGMKLEVSLVKSEDITLMDNIILQIMNEIDQKYLISNRRLNVGNIPAFEYTMNLMSYISTTVFIQDGYQFNIAAYMPDDKDRNKYLEQYYDIVQSFSLEE